MHSHTFMPRMCVCIQPCRNVDRVQTPVHGSRCVAGGDDSGLSPFQLHSVYKAGGRGISIHCDYIINGLLHRLLHSTVQSETGRKEY